MAATDNNDNEYTLTSFDAHKPKTRWAIAVFAYNEEKNIAQALKSIHTATGGENIAIYVLANGCRDATAEQVKLTAQSVDNLHLVETNVADKANAWNLFVHHVLTDEDIDNVEVCFFMDGDVSLMPLACSHLADELERTPRAEAAGAMPACGRDRDSWRQRMVYNCNLAGNCYALRKDFVKHLRQEQVRIPVGLIGEDFFVSWLVESNVWRKRNFENESLRCVFSGQAEFSFRSLSMWHLSDYRTFIRRKWRYALREIQLAMLNRYFASGPKEIPKTVEQLYLSVPVPPLFAWRGTDTLIRSLAVNWVRKYCKHH